MLVDRFVVCSVAMVSNLSAGASMAQQPAEIAIGLKAGEEMPFFVVDFVSGEHKDRGGCPSVMTSNAKAKSVILLARKANEAALQLAAALEAGSVDGKNVLAFLAVAEGPGGELARTSEAAGLKRFSAGVVRGQSWQRLKELGLKDDIALAAVLLDRKTVQSSFLLNAGELTAEKQKEIVASLAALAAKPGAAN